MLVPLTFMFYLLRNYVNLPSVFLSDHAAMKIPLIQAPPHQPL